MSSTPSASAAAPRDYDIYRKEGRDLEGASIFAMEYLPLPEQAWGRDAIPDERFITAKDKRASSSAADDTGADCLGLQPTSTVRPASTSSRSSRTATPDFASADESPGRNGRTSSASSPRPTRKGGTEEYSINTSRFVGENGQVTALETIRVEMKSVDGRMQFVPVPGSEKSYRASISSCWRWASCGPERKGGMLEQFGVELDNFGDGEGQRRETRRASPRSSLPPVTPTRGQSTEVVWAIAGGALRTPTPSTSSH